MRMDFKHLFLTTVYGSKFIPCVRCAWKDNEYG